MVREGKTKDRRKIRIVFVFVMMLCKIGKKTLWTRWTNEGTANVVLWSMTTCF